MKTKLIKTGLALAAFFAATAAAPAADLPYKAPAYVAPAYSNWSGFYVGLNAGYGWGTSAWDVPAITIDPKGYVFGGTLGYNFQTGVWVWGLEADFDYSTIKGSATCGATTCDLRNNWLATGRGRIGYGGWGSFMPYITGGAAFGSLKATNNARPVPNTADTTRIGWTLGAGLEYALFSNWSVKLEYLYVDLGKWNCGTPCGGVATDNVTFKTNLVRAGVNYRF